MTLIARWLWPLLAANSSPKCPRPLPLFHLQYVSAPTGSYSGCDVLSQHLDATGQLPVKRWLRFRCPSPQLDGFVPPRQPPRLARGASKEPRRRTAPATLPSKWKRTEPWVMTCAPAWLVGRREVKTGTESEDADHLVCSGGAMLYPPTGTSDQPLSQIASFCDADVRSQDEVRSRAKEFVCHRFPHRTDRLAGLVAIRTLRHGSGCVLVDKGRLRLDGAMCPLAPVCAGARHLCQQEPLQRVATKGIDQENSTQRMQGRICAVRFRLSSGADDSFPGA